MKRLLSYRIRMKIVLLFYMFLFLLVAEMVSVRAATEEDNVAKYRCSNGVWYQLTENRKAEIICEDGSVHKLRISISKKDEQRIEIKDNRENGSVPIGYGSFCRGIYVMCYDSRLYLAAEMWDITGNIITYLWRENDMSIMEINGTLFKKNGCIEIKSTLYGGVEEYVTVNLSDWTLQETVVETGSTCIVLRPLLVTNETSLSEDSEIRIISAGTSVLFSSYKNDKKYEWYGVNIENEIWWFPMSADKMVLQEAEFCDCFSYKNSYTNQYASLNNSWVHLDEAFCTIYGNGKMFQLCDYIPSINEQIMFKLPVDKEGTIGIVYFDSAESIPVFAFQYSKSEYLDEKVYFYHVCKLYRIVGSWLLPLYADGYNDGELPVRLFYEQTDSWIEGYSDEPVQVLEKNGTIQLNGKIYELQGLNHLIDISGSGE